MSQVEAWLRGPMAGVPALLMPAAHAIQHALDDTALALRDLSLEETWEKPGGAPSVGFHVTHLAGGLDRLLTYARGELLTDAQLAAAGREDRPADPLPTPAALLALVQAAADRALTQIRGTRIDTLLEPRGVGRLQIPSTVLGLTVHAAEHAARHAGQALTTARIVRGLQTGRR